MKKGKSRIIIAILIIIGGIGAMELLVKMRPTPQKTKKTNPGILVDVFKARAVDYQTIINGTGSVLPKKDITIVPQVSGKIIKTAKNFKAGGFFKKNELMFEIEPIDYQLAVERARASLAKAELELANVQGKAKIARDEWHKLGKEKEPSPLVLYEPQVKEALAVKKAEEAGLQQALINLARTKITAPFNCLVSSENIDIGQYIKAGNDAGRLSGTDNAEIIIPLPLQELNWINVPSQNNVTKDGSKAVVIFESNGTKKEWPGTVTRLINEMDEKGRMIRAVVEVEDPYNKKTLSSDKKADLIFGLYVTVLIYGKKIENVIPIPRQALREGSSVWLVSSTKKLQMKQVEISRLEPEKAIVSNGINYGDLVVTSNIIGAANGMKLRIGGEKAEK